jgi:hypothetical protein
LICDGFCRESVENWSYVLSVDDGDWEISRTVPSTEGIAEKMNGDTVKPELTTTSE